MRTFDFYEFVGILTPGAVLLVGIYLLLPGAQSLLAPKDLSLGDLGIFTVLAYVAGHLVQGAGNLTVEKIADRVRGRPTQWVRDTKRWRQLLAGGQREELQAGLATTLGLPEGTTVDMQTTGSWEAICRQIYAAVAAQSKNARIDIFNGNYGLNRGIATALLALLLTSLGRDVIQQAPLEHWPAVAALGIGVILSWYRMRRFAVYYARELFVQFIQLSAPEMQGAMPSPPGGPRRA